MIEAELKARVRDPDGLRDRLLRLAAEEASFYYDTYYDWPDRGLTATGRELRIRIAEAGGQRRVVLTYKEPAADIASGSKPEHETTLQDAEVIGVILSALGLEHLVAFEKNCANYRFTARGRKMLATIATVPEISGVFLEVETLVAEPDLADALDDIRAVLGELGVSSDDLTAETYTDAVISRRSR